MSVSDLQLRQSRPYHVILWGATGFTGMLVAQYLAKQSNLKFAIAGRDEKKLQKIRDELQGGVSVPDVLTASIDDAKSLDALVKTSRVIISTVGPFARYGEPMVAACVRNGTDYCDITGEGNWVGPMIEKYHEEAKKNNVLIVSTCGFDSLPSDLGAFLAARTLNEHACEAVNVTSYVKLNGGASGGTFESVFNIMELPLEQKKKLRNPFSMNPEPSRTELAKARRAHDRDIMFPSYNKEIGAWTIPFIMAGINTRVVRRSAALYENDKKGYGSNFSYNECLVVSNIFIAFLMWFGYAIFFFLAATPFTRGYLRKLLPAPGQGPDAEKRAKSWFKFQVIANGEQQGKQVKVVVKGADPGYSETSRMVSEAAFALAFDRQKLNATGGVVSPAYAFGNVLIERLNAIGITVAVEENGKRTAAK